MTKALWRRKEMPVAEWAALQALAEEMAVKAGGPKDFAMILQGRPSDPTAMVFLTGPGTDALERTCPGNWEDSSVPNAPNIAILVASGDPRAHFGIRDE